MCKNIINKEINDLISRYNELNDIDLGVKDLSYLKTYSIDDSRTFEIDDAISLERLSSKYKLWIHIASPADYIEYQSAIDKKAREVISSVYLSTTTTYMFPDILINNLFNLTDQKKRRSLSVGVIINDDGSVFSSEIVETLIEVNYRLNYLEADELIDYAPKEEEDLNIISNILQNRRFWRKNFGANEILESYGKVILENKIPTLQIIDPTLSRQLISEAMILYGNIISDFTKNNNIPVPYRVQDRANKIDNISDSTNNVLYNFALKKKMGKTYYSLSPMAHNGLGLSSYLHATSPIRRYADLLVQYQLKRFLNNKVLISKHEIEPIIQQINNLGRQNIIRYREDQRLLLKMWFQNNSFSEYQVILLNWINRYKNICILYFVEYSFSFICSLTSKFDLYVGDNFNVKNITLNYKDTIYFELVI